MRLMGRKDNSLRRPRDLEQVRHRRALVVIAALGISFAHVSCKLEPPPAPAPYTAPPDTVLVVVNDTVWLGAERERELTMDVLAAEESRDALAREFAVARAAFAEGQMELERLAALARRPAPPRVDTVLIERDSVRIEGHRSMLEATPYEFKLWLAKDTVLPGPSPSTQRQVLVSGPVRRVGDSARVCLRGGGHFDVQASNASPGDPECETQRFGPVAVRDWTWQVTPHVVGDAREDSVVRLLTFSIRSYADVSAPDFDTTYQVHVIVRPRPVLKRIAEFLATLQGMVASLVVIVGAAVAVWRARRRPKTQAGFRSG